MRYIKSYEENEDIIPLPKVGTYWTFRFKNSMDSEDGPFWKILIGRCDYTPSKSVPQSEYYFTTWEIHPRKEWGHHFIKYEDFIKFSRIDPTQDRDVLPSTEEEIQIFLKAELEKKAKKTAKRFDM